MKTAVKMAGFFAKKAFAVDETSFRRADGGCFAEAAQGKTVFLFEARAPKADKIGIEVAAENDIRDRFDEASAHLKYTRYYRKRNKTKKKESAIQAPSRTDKSRDWLTRFFRIKIRFLCSEKQTAHGGAVPRDEGIEVAAAVADTFCGGRKDAEKDAAEGEALPWLFFLLRLDK